MLTSSNVDILSRDVAIALKHYCFNNITEFFRRYENELNMSKATFHRIVQGEYTSVDKINEVVILAKKLGLVLDDKEGCEWLVKKNLMGELIKKCVTLTNNPSIHNLGEVKTFIDKYRLAVLS